MRILVTGGAGFIGSAIADAAQKAGWDVRVLDSLRTDVHAAATTAPRGPDFIHSTLDDPAALARALDGVDVVCHQAAKVGLGVDFTDAPDYVSSNILGTAILLAAMAERNINRLVLASSMVVYGEGAYSSDGRPCHPPARRRDDLDAGQFDPRGESGQALQPELVDESGAVDPRNVYAVSKLAQEQLSDAWASATGSRAIALRYHNVYGPGMPQNTPYAGVASLFRSAIERGDPPRVFEDGNQRRDFIHVGDVASANLAAIGDTASARPGSFRAFNVASGQVHTIGELAAALSRHANGPEPVITGEYRLGDVRHITASSQRIRSELGWSPTVGFDDGMREFAVAPLREAVLRPKVLRSKVLHTAVLHASGQGERQ